MTVPVPGHASKWQKLLDELQLLLAAPPEPKQLPSSTVIAANLRSFNQRTCLKRPQWSWKIC